jgi:Putative addiction module component
LPRFRFSRTLKGMEVHFTPETEKKLKDIAAQSGRGNVDELLQDVVEEYFGDLAETRETLDRRYDDLASGKVKLIPGDEVIARLRAKSAAHRASRDENV